MVKYIWLKFCMEYNKDLMLIGIKMKKIGNRIRSQWPFENLRQP